MSCNEYEEWGVLAMISLQTVECVKMTSVAFLWEILYVATAEADRGGARWSIVS